MEISESLKRFRKEYNLTQDEIAKVLGTSKQVYYRYEKDVVPSAKIIKKIAVAFGVSADYLLGIRDNNNSTDAIISAVTNCYKEVLQICGAVDNNGGCAPVPPPEK